MLTEALLPVNFGPYNGPHHYDQPASLSALAGSYRGSAAVGGAGTQTVSVSVSANGAVTMPPDPYGCSASGQASPRASGKNVFDLSVTFRGSRCVLGNGNTVHGIIYYDATSKTGVAMALNSSETNGFIFVGSR